MKLTMHERFALIGILPVEGSFTTAKRLRVLRESLGPTDAEKKEFGFTDLTDESGKPTGGLRWNPKFDKEEREIEVGETMTDLIVKTLTALDDAEKLHLSQVSLYEKFVKNAPETASKKDKSPDENHD